MSVLVLKCPHDDFQKGAIKAPPNLIFFLVIRINFSLTVLSVFFVFRLFYIELLPLLQK